MVSPVTPIFLHSPDTQLPSPDWVPDFLEKIESWIEETGQWVCMQYKNVDFKIILLTMT